MLDLGNRRYSNQFDRIATEGWFRNLVLKGPLMFLPVRTDHAFLIAMLSTTPWRPSTPECNVAMICADYGCMWEAVALLRYSIEWAKKRKCWLWRLSSETEFDMEPIARKLGATEPDNRWILRFP